MIRYHNCFNILIDGTYLKGAQRHYESSVVEYLDKMGSTWTGYALFRSISAVAGKTICISPYTAEDAKQWGEDNALAFANSDRDAAPRGVRPHKGVADDASTPWDERYEQSSYEGTGKGSNATVHFTPRAGTPVCPRGKGKTIAVPCRPSWIAENAPDDTLTHELVHALRSLRGQRDMVPTWHPGYENEEEFFAILVTNIYISEKGRRDLRADHKGHVLLDSSLTGSELFLGKAASVVSTEQLENRRLLNKFVCQHFDLSSDLRRFVTAAPFNPVAEYLRHASQYSHNPAEVYRLKSA